MNKEKLVLYEMPSWVEYISNSYIQTIVARFVANKINRKVRRYNARIEREGYLKEKGLINDMKPQENKEEQYKLHHVGRTIACTCRDCIDYSNKLFEEAHGIQTPNKPQSR